MVLLELFSGIGGFSKGLEAAGYTFDKVYFSEIDKHAIANFKYNFPYAEHIGTVTNIGEVGIERPHIVTFGSPCQNFSAIGDGKGLQGGESHLVRYAVEAVRRFGRPFYIYKFRSMRLDAESMGPQLYAGGRDVRLTKIGRFLREHHLDELPQLWNVFCGDMAFIGPRPERKFYIDQIIKHDPRYQFLYQIRPGVTSYATLYNGYTDTMDKMLRRLRYDLFYLQHRSWWFDFKILVKTFINICFGKKF